MAIVSVRVPQRLKEEMRRLDLDWAEYIRRSIEEKVRQERLKGAAMRMDESRRRTAEVQFDSPAEIRKMRDEG